MTSPQRLLPRARLSRALAMHFQSTPDSYYLHQTETLHQSKPQSKAQQMIIHYIRLFIRYPLNTY